MANAVTPEMVKLLNGGDRRELRAFLTLYAKPIYDRALAFTGEEAEAKRVTRRVVAETALLAAKGMLEEDVDAQLMRLTDACCSEDLFFARLVDETMRELDAASAGGAVGSLQAAPFTAGESAPALARNEAFLHEWEAAEADLFGPSAPDTAAEWDDAPALFDREEEDEDDEKKPGPLIVLLIFGLALLTVALVWVLLVKLMHLGILPKFDFGFGEWFNAHVFLLY